MLSSTFQKIAMPKAVRFATIVSSVAVLLAVCESASAQLNVGRYGIQRGLESEYLQYQIQNQNLNQMRVIPACDVGFGLSCNKTGSVVQQLLELNGGPSYQDLLVRAAGGTQNLQNFASFYGNNPNVSQAPYASFWRQDSPGIMDGYQYVMGQNFGRTPVEGLGLVTKNFYWTPYSGVGDSLSLRNGLLNLKLSYGRLLYEEASKLPNVEQQIQSLNLPPDMTKFYLNNISKGLDALSSGDKNQLQTRIFELLSYPYSEDGGELGRPNNAIPQELSQLSGEDIPGDTVLGANPLALEGEAIGLDIATPGSLGDVLVAGSSESFPVWPLLLGVPLLFLLLSGGGDSSSGQPSVPVADIPPSIPVTDIPPLVPVTDIPPLVPNPNECIPTPGGNGSGNNPVIEVPCNPVVPPSQPEVKKVVEPSMIKAFILLIVMLSILRYKQRTIKTNG
ncbi:hypothetical protein FNW02_16275 [Komarekiella sp. 'clone 1']|uniref:Uncharacterized protein n=1 Tax=Komarekiella delphini-convector SJRDD-AB1 TaxID=2593771 RepID=A0AA40VRL8_9NOST|nr:hypothetical protein [Komarekiella delphini-convector]MBD6617340.1 hypothetical protein [Komarekiella delphini-convector SJRDD-AB1]